MTKTSALGARVGDRMLITYQPSPADHDAYCASCDRCAVRQDVIVVKRVTPQFCGCVRVDADRPRSAGGPCPTVSVYPAACSWGHLDAEDFDAARQAAVPAVSSFEDDAEYGAGWNEPPVNLSRTV